MKKFTYKVEIIEVSSFWETRLEEELKLYGNDGWELCYMEKKCSDNPKEDRYKCVFKKEIQ